MSRNLLLVLGDAWDATAVGQLVAASQHGLFRVESVSRCCDALDRLSATAEPQIAALMVDLFLPDCQGISTFETVFRASPRIPILVLSRVRDEATARLAVQRGAQDYLLAERLNEYEVSKAIFSAIDRANHTLAQSAEKERAQLTLNCIGDAVISTNRAGQITYLNPVATSMTGWSLPEARGRPLEDVFRIIDSDNRTVARNPLAMAIRHNETMGLGANCVLVRRDGHESAIEDTSAPIHDRAGHIVGAVIVFHDVTAARALSLRMSYLAQHDFLTELPNRMLLNDRLRQAITFARRHGTSLAVLFIDVDHFKAINDSMGHPVGDELLKSIARRLTTCVRNSDTVSRRGGDEFLVLLSEIARPDDAAVSAQKILEAVSAPHHIAQYNVRITVSIGIGVYPDDGISPERLLENADSALLQAKGQGRNRHQFPRIDQTERLPAARLSKPVRRK
jgi:diguanylate cyclase (GGDEF)-like protein/PAS domain S-box-containing protein